MSKKLTYKFNTSTIHNLGVISNNIYYCVNQILSSATEGLIVTDSFAKSILYQYHDNLFNNQTNLGNINFYNLSPRLYLGIELIKKFYKYTLDSDDVVNWEDEDDKETFYEEMKSEYNEEYKRYITIYSKYKQLDELFDRGNDDDEEEYMGSGKKSMKKSKIYKQMKKIKHNKYKGNKKEMLKKLTVKR